MGCSLRVMIATKENISVWHHLKTVFKYNFKIKKNSAIFKILTILTFIPNVNILIIYLIYRTILRAIRCYATKLNQIAGMDNTTKDMVVRLTRRTLDISAQDVNLFQVFSPYIWHALYRPMYI